MSRTNWSKENLEKIVKESYSIAEVLKKLGLKVAGGNYANAQKHIDEYNLDISHFTGARWQKSPNFTEEDLKRVPLEDILKENTNYKSNYLRERLINAGYKEAKCEECGLSEWNGKPLKLKLHHINGNHYDNRLENLQVLCIQCHSQTDSYRKRKWTKVETPEPLSNKLKPKEKICPVCGKTFIPGRNSQKLCSVECAKHTLRKGNTDNFSKEKIIELAEKCTNMTELGTLLGVSRVTVRKYLERYNLLEQFKAKFNFRAKVVLQYDSNNNLLNEWPSINDVSETLHIDHDGISKCCKFQRKSAGGFIWRYKE